MSVFSDMLKNFIHEKDVKVGSLANYCNLERSTVYKFINGKREPMSAELVDRIAHFLKLTPSETHQLQGAWKMARIGEDVYYIRKSVEHFLSDFPSSSITPPRTNFSYTETDLPELFPSSQNSVLLNSRQAIDSSVHHLLLKEAGQLNGQVALFLQPDYSFLFSLLSSMHSSESLQIQHVFSLNRTTQFTDNHELYELYYLRNIIPVYMNGMDYHTYCFYANDDSRFQSLTIFPCMILTSESAVICSADYQMGIFFHDSAILQALWKLFFSLRDQCLPLFQTIPIATDSVHNVFQFLDNSQSDDEYLIGIQPEACLTPFLDEDILQNNFNHNLPHAADILSAAQNLFTRYAKNVADGKFMIYFTEYGLIQFQKYGTFAEIPKDFYQPLTIPQRIHVLYKVLECCHRGVYRILKKPLNNLAQNLHLCVRGRDGFLNYQTNSGETICMAIYEPSMLQIFQDFLEHMDEDIYCTIDEAEKIISELIYELENETFGKI